MAGEPTFDIINQIEGWFSIHSMRLWHSLMEAQADIPGNLMEIGTWKGRSIAAIAYALRENERFFISDLKLQTEAIQEALTKVGANLAQAHFVGTDSFTLHTHADFKAMENTVRFLHIDGEHSGEAIYRELDHAARIVRRNGLVVIDEFFSPLYAHLTPAVMRYLDRNPHEFRLLMVGFEKGYLCRPSAYRHYQDFIVNRLQQAMAERGGKVTVARTGDAYEGIFGIEHFMPTRGPYTGLDMTPDVMEIGTLRVLKP